MVVLFLMCLVAGILIMLGEKHGYIKIRTDPDCGFVLAAIGITLLFICGMIYGSSYTELIKMEAFYDANRSAYEATVETTKSAIYEISKQAALRIDVENLQQSTNWSDRVAELRDEVVKYNTCIYKLRRYNATWVLSGMFPNPRSDLKLILLQE